VINRVLVQIAVEDDKCSENPRHHLCDRELATLVRGSSVTAHCHAAALLTAPAPTLTTPSISDD